MKETYTYGNNLAFTYTPSVVTAILERPVALVDRWSPTLESILVKQLMLEHALLQFKPTAEQALRSINYIRQYMPLKVGLLTNKNEEDWYWQCSSPCFKINYEDKQEYRKYWNTKDWFPERITSKITWFVVAHTDGLCDILDRINCIGKPKTNSYSLIKEWTVKEVEYDWHLWRGVRNSYYLNKPVPIKYFNRFYLSGSSPSPAPIPRLDTQLIVHWGWKSPVTFDFNQDKCYMPTRNILTPD